jgi:hypothetical protein
VARLCTVWLTAERKLGSSLKFLLKIDNRHHNDAMCGAQADDPASRLNPGLARTDKMEWADKRYCTLLLYSLQYVQYLQYSTGRVLVGSVDCCVS